MVATDRPASPPARNPKALSLKALFPTVDLAVIESVLEAHGGSEDRAVESLLAMTDESFKLEPRELASDTADNDASYARALALEEEEHAASAAARYAASARSASHGQQRQQEHEPAFDPTNIPYQPRIRRGQQGAGQYAAGGYQPQADYGAGYHVGGGGGHYPQHQQQQQGPGLEEQFQKLAVSGKKTLEGFMASGFVRNLKDKVANVQGGMTGAPAGGSNSKQPHSAYYVGANEDPSLTSSSGRPSTPSRQSSSQAYSASANGSSRPLAQTQNPDFPASAWALPDDNEPRRSNSTTHAQINVGPPTPLATSPPSNPLWSAPSSQRAHLGSPSSSTPAAGKRSDELLRHAQTGGRQSPSSSMLGTSPTNLSSSPGSKIDFAKLGLLPRQKISLDGRPASPSTLSTSPSAKGGLLAANTAADSVVAGPNIPPSIVRKIEQPPVKKAGALESDDDDDDLGYTVSPFDR